MQKDLGTRKINELVQGRAVYTLRLLMTGGVMISLMLLVYMALSNYNSMGRAVALLADLEGIEDVAVQNELFAVQANLRTARSTTLVTTIVVISGVLLFGLYGAHRLLQAMARVVTTAIAFIDGDHTVRTGLRGRHEIGILGKCFDQLLETAQSLISQQSEDVHFLQNAIDTLPDFIFAKDRAGYYLVVNRALATYLGGGSTAEVIGKHVRDFHGAETAQRIIETEEAVMRGEQKQINNSEQVIAKNGTKRWHSSTRLPVHDEQGKVLGLVGSIRDNTDFWQAQTEIIRERTLLRTYIDHSLDTIYIKDMEARFLIANKFVASMMGAESPDDLIGKSDYDFYPEQIADQFFADDQNILVEGKSIINHEEPFADQKTGRTGWMLTSKLPLRDGSGAIIGLMGVGRDITTIKSIAVRATEAAKIISETVEQIRSASDQQAHSVELQDSALRETMAAVEALRQIVMQSTQDAQQVAEIARISVEVSDAGETAVVDSIDGMTQIRERVEQIAENILTLSERTQQIGEIIDTVNALADQSKLLALNASIEAARAGEEGKGFAVVAMEVRQLAESSREATNRVRDILVEIQQATNTAVMVTEEGNKQVIEGANLVEMAGDSIRELADHIRQAANAAQRIATSTQQQESGMDLLSAAMSQIREASTQVTQGILQTESGLADLQEIARETQRIGEESYEQ